MNGRVVFKEMATNQLYLPAYFKNGQVLPFQQPFVACDSTTDYLKPDHSKKFTPAIQYLQSIEQQQIDFYLHVNEMPWKDFAALQDLE